MIVLILTMVVLLYIPNPSNSTQTAYDVLNVVFSIAVLSMLSYGIWQIWCATYFEDTKITMKISTIVLELISFIGLFSLNTFVCIE